VLELEGLPEAEAVALLVACGRARQPDLTDDDPTLRAIVHAVDRLPLALELAAARLALFTPVQLLDRLSERLRVLRTKTGGRHRTVRALLMWSWDLLDAPERDALVQAALFATDFSTEAAERVMEVSEDVLDALQGLVDHHLLYRTHDRLVPWQAVRELAEEKLAEHPQRDALVASFVSWAAQFGTRQKAALTTSWTEEGHRELVTEARNLRRAFELGVDIAPELAVTALLAIPYETLAAWGLREMRVLAARAVDLLQDGPLRGRAHLTRCRAMRLSGDWETARHDAERARALLHESPAELAMALGEAATLAAHGGDLASAEALFVEARDELARSPGAVRGVYTGNLAVLAMKRGDFETAERLLHDALDMLARGGSPWNVGRFLVNLANLHTNRARPDLARPYMERAQAAFERVDDRVALAQLGAAYAWMLMHLAELDLAERVARDAIARNRAVGNERTEANAHLGLGGVLLEAGQASPAEASMREGLAIYRQLGLPEWIGIAEYHLGRLLLARGDIDEAAQRLERAADQLQSGRVAYAVYALCHLAVCRADAELLDQAASKLPENSTIGAAMVAVARARIEGRAIEPSDVYSSYVRVLARG
jgi:tetratricopeptide (TPR) repeat protein